MKWKEITSSELDQNYLAYAENLNALRTLQFTHLVRDVWQGFVVIRTSNMCWMDIDERLTKIQPNRIIYVYLTKYAKQIEPILDWNWWKYSHDVFFNELHFPTEENFYRFVRSICFMQQLNSRLSPPIQSLVSFCYSFARFQLESIFINFY